MESEHDNTLESLLPSNDPYLFDFLYAIFKYDPSSRLTAQEALKHPYMYEFYEPWDEPISEPLSRFDFLFEESKIKSFLNTELFEEIALYHFPEKLDTYEKAKQSYD